MGSNGTTFFPLRQTSTMPQQSSVDAQVTSGANLSYWTDSVSPIEFESISSDQQTEVLVIGGGISGLTTAYRLLETGRTVVLVEDGLIGSGETGRTTAHITPAVDDRYYYIENKFGADKAAMVADSHSKAKAYIQQIVQQENIDCDFKIVDGYLFLHPSDKASTLRKELDAATKAGLDVKLVERMPSINSDAFALQFIRQAQFHIMKYLKGLADAIVRRGGKIYTRSRATKVKEGTATVNGYTITSNATVVATNTPFIDVVTMHTKQHPYRTYVIAAKIRKDMITPALWWDTGDLNSAWVTQPYHYVRTQDFDAEHYLLISGGEDHKTGQASKEDVAESERYEALERWTREHFPAMGEVLYRWSGQVMEPVDCMGFIGKNPGNDSIYIITGDSGNGMTHGTIGGLLVTDLINEKDNEWKSLYDPSRTMFRALVDYAEEALNMAAQYGDYFTKGDVDSVDQLAPGNGAVIGTGPAKFAVYKKEDSQVVVFSAICPHLGCILQWNGDEKSFDCPCHGSRFTCEGKLTNGPAVTDLKPVENSKFNRKNPS